MHVWRLNARSPEHKGNYLRDKVHSDGPVLYRARKNSNDTAPWLSHAKQRKSRNASRLTNKKKTTVLLKQSIGCLPVRSGCHQLQTTEEWEALVLPAASSYG